MSRFLDLCVCALLLSFRFFRCVICRWKKNWSGNQFKYDFQITSQHSHAHSHAQTPTHFADTIIFRHRYFPIAVICGQIDYARSQQQQKKKKNKPASRRN